MCASIKEVVLARVRGNAVRVQVSRRGVRCIDIAGSKRTQWQLVADLLISFNPTVNMARWHLAALLCLYFLRTSTSSSLLPRSSRGHGADTRMLPSCSRLGLVRVPANGRLDYYRAVRGSRSSAFRMPATMAGMAT